MCVLVILGLRLLLVIRSFKPCYSLDFDSDCNKLLRCQRIVVRLSTNVCIKANITDYVF